MPSCASFLNLSSSLVRRRHCDFGRLLADVGDAQVVTSPFATVGERPPTDPCAPVLWRKAMEAAQNIGAASVLPLMPYSGGYEALGHVHRSHSHP